MLVLIGGTSMEEKLVKILNEMAEYLNISQMKKLQEVLLKNMKEQENSISEATNYDYLEMFIAAKKIEGCSDRTVAYYKSTVEHLLKCIDTPIRRITTDEIRSYLAEYQEKSGCSKTTVDNIRRNISSFFSWLEEEDYILKSPMKRIHKIKTVQPVKEIISDELIERLRDACLCKRDLAMVDLLYSTGIRVGELVRLNIDDISFEERECVVLGKGDKERKVYFDAKAKLHLQDYLKERNDDNRIRRLGRSVNAEKIHPHKFRRTMATRAIDKGMPIEQVQKILGHSQIDTTMQYAMVNQSNVKNAHRKYIA